jgi:hypothetical protein
MKKNSPSKNKPFTEGGQTINNNATVHKQININTFNGQLSAIDNENIEDNHASVRSIKQAIAQSETDKAIKLLKIFVEENHKDKIDDAILIESRWQHLKKEKYKGVIDSEAHNREQNRIHESLIGFIKLLI